MARCLFVFLLATLIVMASSSYEEPDPIDYGQNDYNPTEVYRNRVSRLMKRTAIASSASSEEDNAKAKETSIGESGIVPDSGEDFSLTPEETPVLKSSSDSDSAEESLKLE